jgi:hypothetical protein
MQHAGPAITAHLATGDGHAYRDMALTVKAAENLGLLLLFLQGHRRYLESRVYLHAQ